MLTNYAQKTFLANHFDTCGIDQVDFLWAWIGNRYLGIEEVGFFCARSAIKQPQGSIQLYHPRKVGRQWGNENDHKKGDIITWRFSCPDHTKLFIRFQLWNCWGLCSEVDVCSSLFTLLQLEMPTDGTRSGWCDQPLTIIKEDPLALQYNRNNAREVFGHI